MKTKHINITNRPAKKLPCILAAFITWLLSTLVLVLTIESSRAEDFTWSAVRSSLWDSDFNWDLGTFPNGPNDTAIFDTDFSSVTGVLIFDPEVPLAIEVNGIVFNPGAINSAFTIGVGPNATLTISGVGITNNSGITQNFVTAAFGEISFTNNATAGSNVTITNLGGTDGGVLGGDTEFHLNSTAGNATLIANGGSGGGFGGTISFFETSTAGNATLIANGGSTGGLGGTISFEGDSIGGTARVEVFGNGNLDISGHSAAGVTVGSIEGSGDVFLGSNNLRVGSNNLSTPFSGVISDDIEGTGGSLTKVGTGTLTLNGVNTYTGLTTVTAGTLAEGVSNAISTGDLTINGATATFDLGANHSDSVGIVTLDGGGSITGTGTSTLTSTGSFEMKSGTVSAILDGSVALNKTTTGTVTLTGLNTYTGPTTVDAGTLLVDGSLALASVVTVNSGATLGGIGTAAGAVTIADGGIFAPGDSPGTPGTFTVGSLSLSDGSLLNYDLGTPGVIGSGANDLTIVNGNLTLDGVLNTTALAGFGTGAYQLFRYRGALTDNTLDIGTVPAGFSASNFTIITGVPNEVDLLVLAGPLPPLVQFWDGPNTRPNGVIDGGTGPWNNFTTNWTDENGNNNSSWQNGAAVFAGTAGTVTVTQPIFFTDLMEFMTPGYRIVAARAGSLNLIGSPIIDTAFDFGTATIDATINGQGGITKMGPGTLILSGANTYLGATTIDAGVLSISSDTNLGTAPGTPVADQLTFNGGTLQVTASFDLDTNRGITLLGGGGTIGVTAANILSYGGVITGAGSLTKTDTGTLVLSGMNTYAGATTLNGGTLAAGAINILPAQTALTVATGATFDLNNFAQSVGSLAGGGSVTLGAATLTTGSDDTSTDFSGGISGLGGLTKVGTGTQTLSGENTYTGPTIVDAGSLLVDGSIGTGLTSVNAAGLLGGGGTIGGSVVNSGIVSPGHSPGTLTVDGNYTQTAGGTLRIEIAGLSAPAHDLLAINGTANLSGTLQVIRLNNFKFSPGDQVTFLTAEGGVNGTFNPVINPFAISGTIVTVQVVYLPNSVGLEATQGSFPTIPGLTPNQIAVANAVDSAVGDPRAADLIAFLDVEPLGNLPHDFDLIAPEELAAIFNIDVSLANIQTINLERRMADIRAGSSGFSATGFAINTRGRDFNMGLAGPTGPEGKSGPSVMQPIPENRWGVFVTGLGEFTNVGDTSNARGYDLSTGGLTFGVDYRVCPSFAIGLTGGYAHTNADLVNNGSLEVDGGKIGAYATGFGGGFYFDAAAMGGLNDYDSSRTALLGSARGNTNGHDFTGLIAGGYEWKKGALTIGPTASFQYTYVEFDGFTESGSLAPLTFNDRDATSSRTALGAKASYDWHVGHILVRPELRAAWQHEFGDRDYSLVSRFASGAGSSFTVNGPAIGRDSLLIGAGAAVIFNDRVSVYAYYDGELARTNYSSNNVSAGVRVSF